MQPTVRKLVTIVTEAMIERDLLETLNSLGVRGYTISDARGRGSRGIRAAGWEHGANIRLEIVCDQTTTDRIVAHLRDHYYDDYAMIVYVSDVEVFRPDKF